MALAKPRPGDLIEIFRIGYEHWAIYVGNGYVVHVVAQGSISGDSAPGVTLLLTEKAIVKKELLCDVARGDEYRVNNKHDDKYRPLPPSKIVQRAEELVGQEMPYNLTSKNCEHFANNLRYRVPRSDQFIDKVIGGLLQTTEFVIQDWVRLVDCISSFLADVTTSFLWSLRNKAGQKSNTLEELS